MLRRFASRLLLVIAASAAIGSVVAWHYVRKWDAVVTEKFRTHRWSFPSKIYSDSLLIYPGIDLQGVGFFERLRDLGYRSVNGRVSRRGEYRLDKSNGELDVYLHNFPQPTMEGAGRPVRLYLAGNRVTRIEDLRNQTELYAFELDPELISGVYRGIWKERHLVTLGDVPRLLLRAIIDVEDQHFYTHHGLDFTGIARALWVDLRSRQVVQGGSTLTQQLMKNFFLTDERSLKRKFVEAVMAVMVERRFSKQEILENYINEIYLGQKGAQGIYGVWEASHFYFSKEPQELSVAEIAMLAGLIKAPNRYSPFRHPERARRRRNDALVLMLKKGDITAGQFRAAVAEPLRAAPVVNEAKDAPYFVDFVRQELAHTYPADVLTTEGLQIHTALDMYLQRLAEQAVKTGLTALERRYPRLHATTPADRLQACLIALQPQTGAIKAMMGGRDYRSTQFNRCTRALRQPGSVFKPFTYLAAFERTRHTAQPILPTTRIEDEPFEWHYDHQVWSPANYKDRYLGTVTVRDALEHSLNAATARLAREVGLGAVIDVAQRMGIRSPLPPYPSVVLGAAEVTPFEVAQAFSVLANSGVRTVPLSIKKVFDRNGRSIERNPVQVEQVVSADTAYLVTHMLEGVLDHGTGRGARARGFARPAAGKTGTTNDYRDAWFVGFTPDLLTVVWVGFDRRRPLDLTGSEAALPIWTDFMKRATAGRPVTAFLAPPGVVRVRIDPLSGELATPYCPTVIDEAFYRGTEPTSRCPLHPARAEMPGLSRRGVLRIDGQQAARAGSRQPQETRVASRRLCDSYFHRHGGCT
ncbi:MAG: PBP1A family penicillin-binding protein [Candidatus Binatia bacterium]